MTLNVFFIRPDHDTRGTSMLHINLITNEAQIELSSQMYINETHFLIEKAKKQLQKINGNIEIEVKIHWETLNENKEEK